jgi:hypothetical protein
MEFVEFGGLRWQQRAELEGDEDDPFDAAGSTLAYQPTERHVAIQDDRGRLIASTGMLIVEVEVRAQRFSVVGFAEIVSEVVVKQPDGYAPMPDRTMWQALHPQATWRDGIVTVHSLPF